MERRNHVLTRALQGSLMYSDVEASLQRDLMPLRTKLLCLFGVRENSLRRKPLRARNSGQEAPRLLGWRETIGGGRGRGPRTIVLDGICVGVALMLLDALFVPMQMQVHTSAPTSHWPASQEYGSALVFSVTLSI